MWNKGEVMKKFLLWSRLHSLFVALWHDNYKEEYCDIMGVLYNRAAAMNDERCAFIF